MMLRPANWVPPRRPFKTGDRVCVRLDIIDAGFDKELQALAARNTVLIIEDVTGVGSLVRLTQPGQPFPVHYARMEWLLPATTE